MPQVDLYDMEATKVGTIDLSSDVFEAQVREDLLHTVVRWQLTKRRSGTASTKTRGEIRGGGQKPWRQKGLGRARQGSIRSPLWRGGGVVFGPKPKDWGYDLPKKVRKQALISALSLKYKEGKITVLKDLLLVEIKTKLVSGILRKFGVSKALFIDGDNEFFKKSSRNVKGVKYLHKNGLNVYDILLYDNVFITKDAAEYIQEVYSN